jgi:UDP-N-acetylglucosamine/UDP-N-acetylgalactosamine diphosphorylase
MHIDRLQGLKRRFGCELPLWVMTSPATDVATREFFREQDDFGLGSDELVFFCQGTMPAVSDTDGRILMSAADSLALSPDGHGGMLAALLKSGLLETATERGIDHLYYAQVDNPLITLGDPDLIGYHSCLNSQLTTQVVRKRFATEKVGNVVAIDGRTQIIEYSDLPESAAQQTLADGSLKLWAGNIAVHVFDTDFLKQVASSAESLPFHRAHKAVSFFDASGSVVEAKQPNANKFERFIFDLLPLAERTLVVEGDAAEVFAPVKNADGAAVDTPTTARQALLALHRRWLCEAGVEVSQEVAVEIHPGWAWDAQEVAERVEPPLQIVADTYLT